MRTRLMALGAVATIATLATCLGVACDQDPVIVYTAQLLEPTRLCLDPYTAIDVVPGGNGASTCVPVCLIGGGTFVSTVCPPYPPAFDTTGTDPSCADALSAFARMDECLPDGGSTNPLQGTSDVDAGSDAQAGGDSAASDGATDDGATGDATSD